MTAVAAPTLFPAVPAWRQRLGALLRRPAFSISLFVLLGWVVVAVSWRLYVPYAPDATNAVAPFGTPSGAHLLGTDWLGRDVFSRLLAGSTSVIILAPAITVVALVVGSLTGLVTGYYGGIVDVGVMRVVDAVNTMPGIVLSVLALTVLGRSDLVLVLVIAGGFAPLVARTVRASVLAERERDYVDAARLRQEKGAYMIGVEILPNVMPTILVEGAIRLGYAVFAVATLSFLGLGPQQPSPDWGLTVSLGVQYVQNAPWILLAPSVAIASLVISVNLVADELRREFLH